MLGSIGKPGFPDPDDRRRVPRALQPNASCTLCYERPRRGLRPVMVVEAVDVLDLSMTGALLRTPGATHLTPGATVVLRAAGGSARAEVCHRVPTPEPAPWAFYGVRFTDIDTSFRRFIVSKLDLAVTTEELM